jgi:uncharacterized protein DUF2797
MSILWSGTLRKMGVEAGDQVQYRLVDGWHDREARVDDLPLNPLLSRDLRIEFNGTIACTACGRVTKRSFNQGYCYPCSQSLAEADICIIKPELCHFHDQVNPCRDNEFARTVCFNPHIFYVSLTSGVKIGITREANVPSRWIDQGAVRAIPLASLPDRFTVGKLEAELAGSYVDKTHWMRMLKEENPQGDLPATADEIVQILRDRGIEVLPDDRRVEHVFHYPVMEYPVRVSSHNLDKTSVVEGQLLGIKGQYLIFDTGVMNVRKFTGYQIALSEAV